jgi:hypothetical protein
MHRSFLSLCTCIFLATATVPGLASAQETGARAGPNKKALLGNASRGAEEPNKKALLGDASRGAVSTKAAAPGLVAGQTAGVKAGPNKKILGSEASRGAVIKRQGRGLREHRSTASDIWVGTDGGWHMDGGSGRGIYYGFDGLWDEQYGFTDDLPVGARQGWTYKEMAWDVYIFFGSVAGQGDCSGDRPFDVMWSTDNVNFNPFQCSR